MTAMIHRQPPLMQTPSATYDVIVIGGGHAGAEAAAAAERRELELKLAAERAEREKWIDEGLAALERGEDSPRVRSASSIWWRLQTFAVDVIDRERFNLVIGVVFLAIVLFSPDGLLGLWSKLRMRFGPTAARRP